MKARQWQGEKGRSRESWGGNRNREKGKRKES